MDKQKKIGKPLSIQRREFISKLQDLLNGGLDLYIVEPILVDALATVRNAIAHREVVEEAEYNNQNIEQKGGIIDGGE